MTPAMSASFEDAFNQRAASQGRILVNQLAILIKVAQMHDLKNEAVVNAAEALAGTLRGFFEHRRGFSLVLIGEYLFLEDMRIKYNVEDFNNFDLLVVEFKKRKVGAVNFSSSLTAEELVTFVEIFLSAEVGSEEVYHEMSARIGGSGVSGISTDEIKPPKAQAEFEKVLDAPKAATKGYIRVVLRLKELLEGAERGNPADMKRMKRSVQSLVDSVYKGEPTLLRLAAIRRPDDVLPRHYTNVCVLSLCIGKRLGLSKYHMARLGMAALLHDIGRAGLPEEMFAGDELEDAAWEILKRHPRRGVETILRLKGLNEVAVSAMIVAYEHHRNLDGSGYPEQVEPKTMSLFSRIVRIADNYDASTSTGVYGRVSVQPDRALDLMLKRAGKYYDGEILALFVKLMGAYPVGSFVYLSDGSYGVVSAPGSGREGLDRPKVTLISGTGTPGEVIDLSERDEEGKFPRGITRALDPYKYRINIYKYLL